MSAGLYSALLALLLFSTAEAAQNQASCDKSGSCGAQSTQQPLLGLVMIVKNEAYQLRPVLQSVKAHIDYWMILDTGSTDGTQAIVQEELGHLPGRLEEEPFVDYSTSRNRALELYGNATVYRLYLDGGDELIDGPVMRKFLEAIRNNPKKECIKIEWRWSGTTLMVPNICRTDAPWKYYGKVHNWLGREDGTFPWISCHQCIVKHTVPDTKEEAERHRLKWLRDIEVLKGELEINPEDGRSSFYLAQSYYSVDMYKEAFEEYKRSYAIKGWNERIYMSACRGAQMCELLPDQDFAECQDWYLKAYQAMPTRAEPFHYLARHYRKEKQYHLCYAFAKLAMSFPYPNEASQDVSRHMYDVSIPDDFSVCAYWTQHHKEGLAAARKALEAEPDNERIAGNVKHHLRELAKQQEKNKDKPQKSAAKPLEGGNGDLIKDVVDVPLPGYEEPVSPFAKLDQVWVDRLAKVYEPVQAGVRERTIVAQAILAHAPGNVLVFGVGVDPSLYAESNKGGVTVFLEHDPVKVNRTLTALPSLAVHHARYHTYARDADLLLGQDSVLEINNLPSIVNMKEWDVIVVDVAIPDIFTGNHVHAHGPMQAIYTAARLARSSSRAVDVFVHGCDQKVHAQYASRYLQDDKLVLTEKTLRYYRY